MLKAFASMDEVAWTSVHHRYWQRVANTYNSLYESEWARLENAYVRKSLDFLAAVERPIVLDVAAGTGLGESLVLGVNRNATYVALDLSPAMLSAGGGSFPAVVASMDALPIRDNSIDVATCLFTSLSFGFNPSVVLAEIARVLVPGGTAYLSALSAGSISLRWRGGDSVSYHTRGDRGETSVPVHRLAPDEMTGLVAAAGLVPMRIEPLNALSGVVELPILWRLGRLLARARQEWSHSIELTARKPEAIGRTQ